MRCLLLYVIGAAVVVVLLYAAFKAKIFVLQRGVVIAAPPDRAFALINDLNPHSPLSVSLARLVMLPEQSPPAAN